MRLEGTWYSGDSFRYCITEDMLPAEELREEIKDVIVTLRPLYEEFITIDLYTDGQAKIDKPIFFQLYRDRDFKMTDFYVAEIAIKRDEWTEIYSRRGIVEKEILELFEEVCLKRECPDLTLWKRFNQLFGKKKDKLEEEKWNNELKRLEKIVAKYFNGEVNDDICIEAIKKILEYNLDYLYVEYLVAFIGIGEEGGQKIKRLFNELSCNPTVALAMGKEEYLGKLGRPDYEKAFEYFTHASKIGSVSANYYLGQMYKYGFYVEKDEQKYEELTMSVYQLLLDADARNCMPGIDYVIYELAEIEKQKGEVEKSLDYCLLARESAIECSVYGGGISSTVEQATKLLYELIEFDKSDMDLFDLFYQFENPCRARLSVEGNSIIVEALEYKDKIIIKCGRDYYRNFEEFLKKYMMNGKQITTLYNKIDDIEVLGRGE